MVVVNLATRAALPLEEWYQRSQYERLVRVPGNKYLRHPNLGERAAGAYASHDPAMWKWIARFDSDLSLFARAKLAGWSVYKDPGLVQVREIFSKDALPGFSHNAPFERNLSALFSAGHRGVTDREKEFLRFLQIEKVDPDPEVLTTIDCLLHAPTLMAGTAPPVGTDLEEWLHAAIKKMDPSRPGDVEEFIALWKKAPLYWRTSKDLANEFLSGLERIGKPKIQSEIARQGSWSPLFVHGLEIEHRAGVHGLCHEIALGELQARGGPPRQLFLVGLNENRVPVDGLLLSAVNEIALLPRSTPESRSAFFALANNPQHHPRVFDTLMLAVERDPSPDRDLMQTFARFIQTMGSLSDAQADRLTQYVDRHFHSERSIRNAVGQLHPAILHHRPTPVNIAAAIQELDDVALDELGAALAKHPKLLQPHESSIVDSAIQLLEHQDALLLTRHRDLLLNKITLSETSRDRLARVAQTHPKIRDRLLSSVSERDAFQIARRLGP